MFVIVSNAPIDIMMIAIISCIIAPNHGAPDFVNFANKWLNGNNFLSAIAYGTRMPWWFSH